MSYLFLNVNLFSRKKEHVRGFIPILVIIAIALVAIPVTTVLVKQQQDNRQRAYFTEEGGGGGGKIGCPNPPPEGGTNSCVPSSWFSSCPGGSYPYGSPDGDSDCTAAASGESSMCCYSPPAPIPTTPLSCTYGSCVNEGHKTQSGDPSGYYICQGGCYQYESCPSGSTFNSSSSTCENSPTCAQKYGTGYQCLTSFATECQSGTIQSTNGTDCVDSAGFDVSCCKAPPPTPTPSPTPTNAPLLTCSQKYGTGYQCLTSFATECQSGTIQSTNGTDCVDSAGFDVSCCKAAAPTTKVTGICPAGNADGSTNVCRPDGSSIGKSICPLGEEYVPDGNYCSAQNGGNDYVCCKKPVFQCAYNKGFCSLPTTCGKGYGPASNSTDCDAEGFTCCLPNPTYACEANGGRCINPLSTSCGNAEKQYTEGTSTCAATNQVCCLAAIKNVTQYIFRLDEGFTCTNDIIYNIESGETISSPNVTDCKKQGKKCKFITSYGDITSASYRSFPFYTCIDTSLPEMKDIDSEHNNNNYCGAGNNINKLLRWSYQTPSGKDPYYVPLPESDKDPVTHAPILIFNAETLVTDCALIGKICTTIDNLGICSSIQFSTKDAPAPASRVTDTSGIKQGNNEGNYSDDTIKISFGDKKWYESGSYHCKNENIFFGFNPLVDCKKDGLRCMEKDQKIYCGAPIIVNSTPIDHMYCGDKASAFDFDVSTMRILNEGLGEFMMAAAGLDSFVEFAAFIDNPNAKYPIDKATGYTYSKAGQISATQLSAHLAKKGVNPAIAESVAIGVIGHVGLVVNPGMLSAIYKSGVNWLKYKVGGNNFDYWTCNGDKMEKRRIDVDSGKADPESRNCPSGTACTIFNNTCVVCAKKTLASVPVLGESTSSICTLKKFGDANCDNKVDNNDLLIFRKEILSKSGMTADFDNDGRITTFDLENFSLSN